MMACRPCGQFLAAAFFSGASDVSLEALLREPRTLIMGVLNVTPDSFSDGGAYLSAERAVARAQEMIQEGADILDVGGESSRPGAEPVTEDEEMRRVLPVIEAISTTLGAPVSVDTMKSAVAAAALDLGAEMVNDITALRSDPVMADVVAGRAGHVALMHMKGTPRDMQQNPHYDDVIAEIHTFLRARADYAISRGISREKILVDPGIGFGKRLGDNFTILSRLESFRGLGFPLLVGPSRKSFIGQTLGLPVTERLEGTAAVVTAAILHGAKIVRVHDVRAMKRVAIIADVLAAEGAVA